MSGVPAVASKGDESVAASAKPAASNSGAATARGATANLGAPARAPAPAVTTNKAASKDAKSVAPAAKAAETATAAARVGVIDLGAPAAAPAVAANTKEASVPNRVDPFVQDSARERNVYSKAAGKKPSQLETPVSCSCIASLEWHAA